MQGTAQGYFMFELTHSPAFLGYVAFAAGLPTWVFMMYGGVIADRMSRQKLLIITQAAMMILALTLSALTFTKLVQPWHIIVLAFGLGVANAFDAPARQAFVREMVPREDMTNAIALNGAMFNLAAAVGPAIAGITYSLFGPAYCFLFNGISFIAVIAALAAMKLSQEFQEKHTLSFLSEIKEGVIYTWSQSVILILILIIGLMSLFGISFITLIPAWAVEVLHGDARTAGYLQGARGAGALLGALSIATLGSFQFKGKLLSFGTMLFPVTVVIFSFIRWEPLSFVILFAVGIAQMMIMNLANALVQEQVSDRFRGRVMSIYGLTFFGMMPFGGLLVGTSAEFIGAPTTILLCSIVLLTFSIILQIARPKIRQLT